MKGKQIISIILLGMGFLALGYVQFLAFSHSLHLGFLVLIVLFFYSTLLFALLVFSISRYLSPAHREKLFWTRAIILDFFLQLYVYTTLSFLNIRKWQTKGDKTPILLVHGYLHSSAVWIHIMRLLQKSGFGPIYTLKMGNPFASIAEFAEMLGVKADEIAKETGRNELILIGHSMGGLVCSYYALEVDKKEKVSHVITIGSPLKGTQVAKIGLGKCASEMALHSTFTETLVQDMEKKRKVQFFHIGTKTDQLVIPYSSCFVIEDPKHTLLLDGVGHIGLLFSKIVAMKIAEWIKK